MADFAHYTDRRKFSDAVHDKMAGKVYRCLGGELDGLNRNASHRGDRPSRFAVFDAPQLTHCARCLLFSKKGSGRRGR